MRKKGFGVEDTPFMITAAVLVMMVVVWIGSSALATFTNGNERQAAADAASEIFKRARLVSVGYDGSSDRLRVSVPEGYALRIDGSVVALGNCTNGSVDGAVELTSPMSVQGVSIIGDTIGPGEHKVSLVYSRKDGTVSVSWE